MSAFDSQTAVITGGGAGIGAAIALALAEKKAKLYLIARSADSLQSIALKAQKIGAETVCCPADLGNESSQRELVQRLAKEIAHLDVLVHCAAMYASAPVSDSSLEDFDRHYRINVRAPYAITQALLPKLKARCGQIVFINSSGGISAKPLLSQYDSTKHALKAIADSLRGEVNADGVRILSVYLGRTATDLQARIQQAEGKVYQPELLLQPQDVASVVIHALGLPRTAEVTDIHIRPMTKQ